jgi:hypothetical protein
MRSNTQRMFEVYQAKTRASSQALSASAAGGKVFGTILVHNGANAVRYQNGTAKRQPAGHCSSAGSQF